MPELPEAETIARDLARHVAGRRITGIVVSHTDVLGAGMQSAPARRTLAAARIRDVDRRGKNVLLRFEDGRVLAVNLGMTGRLFSSRSPRAGDFRHVAVRIELDDGHAILYDDIRRFGRLELYTAEDWADREATLGVEPLAPSFTPARLAALTRASRTPIRNWLLDQRRVAGVGNIYANEALHRARVHPARAASSLSRTEVRRLHDALRTVLSEAVEARGTTISDYRDANGEAGGYQPRLRAYGREGRPCPRCGEEIRRIVFGNRSAYHCPRCQPEP